MSSAAPVTRARLHRPMPIRRLQPSTVNRIAAGEVVERPASAVKELVENALDAGASTIEVQVDGGGLRRILVADDGGGIPRAELALAVERHATSKLAERPDGSVDLLDISTLGFRGEALPSIGSVARLSLTSRARGEAEAWRLGVDAGVVGEPGPAAFPGPHGTRVEVLDLFHATPARLKFAKSERAESMAVSEEVRRQAMAHPQVSFTLDIDGRRALRLPAESGPDARLARLAAVLGREFGANSLAVEHARDGVRLTGHAGLPTTSRGNAQHQFLFVNGRPVKDRLLAGALRAGYADVLAHGRHPAAVLFLDLSPQEVDVNVHPAKAEVRFRDPALVRGLLVGALRHALAGEGFRPESPNAAATLATFRPEPGARAFGGWTSPPSAAGCSGAGVWASAAATAALPGVAETSARVEPPPEVRGRGSDRPARLPPGRRAGAAARDLYRRPDARRAGDRGPTRRARAAGLRAHEGAGGSRPRPAPGAAAARSGGARPRRGRPPRRRRPRACGSGPGGRALRHRGPSWCARCPPPSAGRTPPPCCAISPTTSPSTGPRRRWRSG